MNGWKTEYVIDFEERNCSVHQAWKKKRTIQFSYANVDSFSFQPLLFSWFEKW